VEVSVGVEGHIGWKQAKLDYLNVDPFPLSLVGEDIDVVVLREV
jgi:hypothetical protein